MNRTDHNPTATYQPSANAPQVFGRQLPTVAAPRLGWGYWLAVGLAAVAGFLAVYVAARWGFGWGLRSSFIADCVAHVTHGGRVHCLPAVNHHG